MGKGGGLLGSFCWLPIRPGWLGPPSQTMVGARVSGRPVSPSRLFGLIRFAVVFLWLFGTAGLCSLVFGMGGFASQEQKIRV